MSPLNAAICTTISYTLWVEWYYLKNNYLILRSKVKVPRRSLWYATHCLMVMHPHTKYHWPISKDKNVMARTSFAEKKQKWKKKIRLKQYVSLRSKGRHNKFLFWAFHMIYIVSKKEFPYTYMVVLKYEQHTRKYYDVRN